MKLGLKACALLMLTLMLMQSAIAAKSYKNLAETQSQAQPQ